MSDDGLFELSAGEGRAFKWPSAKGGDGRQIGWCTIKGVKDAEEWIADNVVGRFDIFYGATPKAEYRNLPEDFRRTPLAQITVWIYLYEETDMVRALLRWG